MLIFTFNKSANNTACILTCHKHTLLFAVMDKVPESLQIK